MKSAWLILGASSAIARAFARRVAASGADILLVARDGEDANALAADLVLRGSPACRAIGFDSDVAAAFKDFSAGAVPNVFLAFGTMPAQSEIDADPAALAQTLDVNFAAPVALLHRLMPVLEATPGGAIVALGSVAGDRGRLKNYVYGSAKAGLHAYLQGLRARGVRSGVQVVTVKPGFVDTAMTWGLPGMFLVASPDAIAAACLAAIAKKRDTIYAPFFWWGIMTIIRHIPERIFKKLNI
jgi:decaprenylphospho-beta-D-erythro-pentofuranosid-2-ulose 2-reductase